MRARISRWLRRWWPASLMTVAFVGAGLWGLDFGHHWDEPWFFIPLRRFAREGALLPGAYNYPSLSYYLSYLAGLPELVDGLLEGKRGLAVTQHLAPHVDALPFRLRARGLFLAVTALTVPCVYGSILATGRSVGVAAAGAAAVLGSFEVAYHARWVAPDGPLLAASALTTWGLAAAEGASDPTRAARWRRWAAVGAGLSTGTKYTAGLLLLPVMALAARGAVARASGGARVRTVVAPFVVFCVVYLITTPATLLDAELLLTHIQIQLKTYGGGFGAYSVESGLDHLGRMLLYLGSALWSPYWGIALVMTALTVVGAAVMTRRRPWLAGTLLSFPVLFVAYFSLQRTMIVRNLLVLVPPLAVALAWGVDATFHRFAGRTRALMGAAIAVMLAVNVAFVGWAADTVRHRRDRDRFDRAAARYVAAMPRSSTYLSPRARARLGSAGAAVDLSVATTTVAARAEVLVLETDEGFGARGEWPANVWGLTETWFGPWEVGFDRYPTWDGDARLIVMRRAMAERIRLPFFAEARSDRPLW